MLKVNLGELDSAGPVRAGGCQEEGSQEGQTSEGRAAALYAFFGEGAESGPAQT